MASQMVRLVVDDSLRYRLAVGARQTAEPLSWECELDRLDASYRHVALTTNVIDHGRILYAR
jgi:hypothetical protein